MIGPYDRTTYGGRVVDQLTAAALTRVAQLVGFALTLAQGSYNTGVETSAGTHDGGGVVDLSVAGWSPERIRAVVAALRRVGFAAWYRPPIPDLWGAHIHAVLIGNRKLSPAARAQVAEYLAGFDGLAGDGRDTGPRQYVGNRFTWRAGRRRITKARQLLLQARALLSHRVRGYPRVAGALRSLGVTIGRLPSSTRGQDR